MMDKVNSTKIFPPKSTSTAHIKEENPSPKLLL